MTPERLTYQTQTPYARGGGNFMVDAGTQEMAGMQNFNQALRASEKRAAEIAEAEKQAQKEAKKAAAEAAEMKMDKLLQKQKKEEEQEKTKGKKEGEKETGETYEGKEGGETVKEAAALKARVEKYFPQKIPSSVAKEAQVFYDNAGGKPLPEVTTKELTKGYVRCRSEAEKNEERLDFLSEIKKELEGRGVNAEGTYKASTEYYMQLLKGEHEKLVKERALSAESQAKKALVEEELEKQGKVIEKIKGGLREEWYAEFTEKELRDPDTRSTIEAAIEKGYHPKSVTSKRAVKQVAEDVVRNALIEDKQTRERAHELLEKENLSPAEEIEILATHSERLNRAEIILQTKLTEKQKMAIIKAHYTGKGGVFGYLERELLEKGRILNEAFTRAQREALIEAGIAAEPINVPGAVNNTSLINIKADIDASLRHLTYPFVSSFVVTSGRGFPPALS
ncbi:hypothetical protein M1307_00155 [Patescibacteria group bacterium]|nr:hypothetical protein [Patescibacteria group bacterium]